MSKARRVWVISSCLVLGSSGFAIAQAPDTAAAEALMKKSECFQCHAAARKKDGPSFKETVAKYKGKADAEATIYKFVTTRPKVKVDGKEEEHDTLKTTNEGEIRNVIRYILSF